MLRLDGDRESRSEHILRHGACGAGDSPLNETLSPRRAPRGTYYPVFSKMPSPVRQLAFRDDTSGARNRSPPRPPSNVTCPGLLVGASLSPAWLPQRARGKEAGAKPTHSYYPMFASRALFASPGAASLPRGPPRKPSADPPISATSVFPPSLPFRGHDVENGRDNGGWVSKGGATLSDPIAVIVAPGGLESHGWPLTCSLALAV